MQIHFLGGATTVTGSQYLLATDRAQVLIDCGMFQGSPNESIRNRIPFAYDPRELDAVLLTHAHLDHCGLLPLLVKEGYRGRIHATPGTDRAGTLVLLDSGKLHEEFAKREARWEKRHPDRSPPTTARRPTQYEAAAGRWRRMATPTSAVGGSTEAGRATPTSMSRSPEPARAGAWPSDPEAELRAQPPHLEVDLDAPLYTAKDAELRLPSSARPYGEEIEVAPGVHATFVDAGHILGSAIIRLRVQDTRVARSGDRLLGRPRAARHADPARPDGDDRRRLCPRRSTYGGREHEPEAESIRLLAETVRMVADAGGVCWSRRSPSGGRRRSSGSWTGSSTRGEIPLLPLYLDSPMASKASDIYRHHPEYYDEETGKLLREGATPLDYPNQIVRTTSRPRRRSRKAPRPYMIVASNGMLTGGRVVGHLRNLIDDPTATILFVGYQGEGTLGAHLQAGRRGQARRPGPPRPLPGPLDQRLLRPRRRARAARLARDFAAGKRPGDPGYPRRVFLVHGDPEAQIALEPKVRDLGFATHVPHWHEHVTLD